jgi:DNA modification methylase
MHVRKLNEGSKQLSPTATNDDHINETPIEVWKKVITHFVPEGGLIVDPTMGSGSVGKAAILLGRQYWGCELDPEFYGKAERKLAKVQPLRKLFDYSAEVIVDAEENEDSVRDVAETGDPLSHMWKGR